ncbi:MAG TPA: hypothetical protein DEP84_06150, partial [Chloroflexi bacterium]|nr:hypothetical protein [Chloroflexota bacterium]
MTTEVVMPKLGLTMEEGTIERWLKREGDAVEKGEPLLEILTDKVTAEVEAPVSGKVGRLLFPDGATVSVGEVITHILLPGDADGEPGSEATAEDVARTKIQTPLRAPRLEEKRVMASPIARRLAKELGIDLATVPGSGPRGRISDEDVRRVAARRGQPE